MKKSYFAIGLLILICITEGVLIKRLIFMQTPEGMQKRILLPPYTFTDSVFINQKTAAERRTKLSEIETLNKRYPELSNEIGLVTADGTWMSDTEIANDFNTVHLECWKTFNHCFASQAEINDYSNSGLPLLYLGSDLYEITKWDLDEIKATSGTGMGCFEYELTMDRINQKVTSIRKKVGNEGLCEGTSDKPLMIYLGSNITN